MRTGGVALALALACTTAAEPAQDTKLVNVKGRSLRVWTAGLDRRAPGQPVLILEAGAGEGLDEWMPAVDYLTPLAPVIAYDRHGIVSVRRPARNGISVSRK
jgi:hypothetical protein